MSLALTTPKPDDWHVHMRSDQMLKAVTPYTVRQFRRALVMPNTQEIIDDFHKALRYRNEIMRAVPRGQIFQPLMTIYLTDATDPKMLIRGFTKKIVFAAKLYLRGATTNAQHGVSRIERLYNVFEAMESAGMPLCIHGELPELNGKEIDPLYREQEFIIRKLEPLRRRFPRLKITLEHISTKLGVECVRTLAFSDNPIGATITPHHLMLTHDDLSYGGQPRPHLECLPTPKFEEDLIALRDAATSGEWHDRCFFAGTDSAPHTIAVKERQGAYGIFNAPAALELYAEVFEAEKKLENLEKFVSINGATHYDVPVNEEKITLIREPQYLTSLIDVGDAMGNKIQPFCYHTPGSHPYRPIRWRIRELV